jgi:hypothetical protein
VVDRWMGNLLVIIIEQVRNMMGVSFANGRRPHDKCAGNEERCGACEIWLVALLLSPQRIQTRKNVVEADAKVL